MCEQYLLLQLTISLSLGKFKKKHKKVENLEKKILY